MKEDLPEIPDDIPGVVLDRAKSLAAHYRRYDLPYDFREIVQRIVKNPERYFEKRYFN